MIGGFQPLAFQPAYQQVGSVGTPHYSGGWTDLPTGKRKTKKQLREEREKWGVIPKQAKVIIKRVAAQQYEAPDNTEALIAAFGRAELAYKTQYAALYRMEVERQLAMMREEEEFILLH
jgi:hypothetical protein